MYTKKGQLEVVNKARYVILSDAKNLRERLYDIVGALSLMRDLPGIATSLNPGAHVSVDKAFRFWYYT